MKRIILHENRLCVLNEVRYIDAASKSQSIYNPQRPYRTDVMDAYKQDKIQNNESIRVFHGCSIDTALEICTKGTSGKRYHPRTYSYESGMNPLGIFVSVDFEQARKFGYSSKYICILEFTAKASDLEAPIWNGNSYFGQGSNPQPFTNAEERQQQKAQYVSRAKETQDDSYFDFDKKEDIPIDKSYIRDSDKPDLAASIFDDTEHQALFMGDLNPNMIKRVWVRKSNSDSFTKYSRKDFVRTFAEKKEKRTGRLAKRNKELFQPNENVKSSQDIIDRILDSCMGYGISKEQLLGNFKDMGLLDNPPTKDYAIEYLGQHVWPKQIIQAYGKDFFNQHYNRLKQDF